MSESSVHTALVRSLCDWVSTQARSSAVAIMYSDLPENLVDDKPPSINGYFPDMYCVSRDGKPIYIGEAKTVRDLESKRSRDQLAAYLRFLALYESSSLVVAVPWHAVPTARSLVRAIQRVGGSIPVSVHFLEMLPG